MVELTAGTFYGSTASFSIADALLSEVLHPDPRTMPEHTHAVPHFCLLLSGTYEESAHGEKIVFAPQTIVYRPAHASHRDTVGEGGALFFIVELGPVWQAAIEAQGAPRTRISDISGGETAWLATRLHGLFRERDPESVLAVESLLYELCGHVDTMRRDLVAEPAWCKRVAERVGADFASHVDLRVLAADAAVHPAHLTRVYRRFRGRSIGEDVAALRVQHACRLLTGDGVPLTDVASACGFADQSHLTRVFSAHTGTTPARYRKRLRPR
jgi:AraC family transcriptional regulator